MSKLFDFTGVFSRDKISPFSLIEGSWMLCDKTPSHQFVTIIAPIMDGKYYVALPTRDCFDESLALSILSFVAERQACCTFEKPVALIEGFKCPGYMFDTVAILIPSTAKQFEYEDSQLSNITFVAFPIYRCELSGKETPEMIDEIRHGYLPSLNWRRPPCPLVRMAYRNPKNKTSSRPKLSKISIALAELSEMRDAPGSWVELQNYAGEKCLVTWINGTYSLKITDGDAIGLDIDVLRDRVVGFLMHNLKIVR